MSAAAAPEDPLKMEGLVERAYDLRQDHETLSIEPLLDLVDELLGTIDTMQEWHPESSFNRHAARFAARLVRALEEGVENDRWISTREAARLAEVSRETVRAWCRDGRVRHSSTPSGAYRVDQADVVRKRAA